jgi:hypothetical protein
MVSSVIRREDVLLRHFRCSLRGSSLGRFNKVTNMRHPFTLNMLAKMWRFTPLHNVTLGIADKPNVVAI